jgi:hypothetical protein
MARIVQGTSSLVTMIEMRVPAQFVLELPVSGVTEAEQGRSTVLQHIDTVLFVSPLTWERHLQLHFHWSV